MFTNKSILLNTDSYKMSHYLQYPPKTTKIFSYIESRGSKYSNYILFFGLQAFLKEYLSTPITEENIIEAKNFSEQHGLPFNEEGWRYILTKHNGILPLRIRGVREGILYPTHEALVTVENTDDKCFWLTSYIETALLRGVWYPSSVATISMLCKNKILKALEETSDDPKSEIDFKLHDFGARGVNTLEGAEIGGMAHLVNFKGTDTISGIKAAMKYYNSGMCGFSIPAAEHSTMTAWGRENEKMAYKNMVEQFSKPNSIFAVVSDSYDVFSAIENIWCGTENLLDMVEKTGGTVVIRPDSGDPTQVPIQVIELLMNHRGFTLNSKGYKVLPKYVRVIQGDGIDLESIGVILENMKKHGLSASNIAFGMGGGLLQQVNRDTFKWAMKCSAAIIDDKDVDVYKDPITDVNKKSKKGFITMAYVTDGLSFDDLVTVNRKNLSTKKDTTDIMKDYYYNGIIERSFVNFDTIRERASKSLDTMGFKL